MALLLVAALLASPGVAAHAVRVDSEPAAGARLEIAPTEVTVTMSEPIEPSSASIVVTNENGDRVDVGRTTVTNASGDRPVLRVALLANLTHGAYLVRHTVLSGDTHAVSDTFGFSVGPHLPPTGSSANSVDGVAAFARFVAFAGLAVALGAFLFVAWLRPAPNRVGFPALAVGCFLHVAGVAALFLRTSYRAGYETPTVFLATQTGELFAWRLILGACALLLALLALMPRNPSRLAAPLAGLLTAASAIVAAMLSHHYAHGVGAIAVDALHLLAAATWVGGLILFLSWLALEEPAAAAAQRIGLRFGSVALGCVVVLAMTGVTSAFVLAGAGNLTHPTLLLGGPWGRFLALKIGLFGVMLAAASINRFVFLAHIPARGLTAWLQRIALRLDWGSLTTNENVPSFRRLVAFEAGLGVFVLLLAGLLTAVSPPA